MSTLNVGSGQSFSRLSDAVAAAADGDLIRIQAGTYTNDFMNIAKRLTIEGVGGVAKLVATEPPWNGKAVLVTQSDVTLRNIEISGATSGNRNGAAIRHENGNLVLDQVYFHHNQNGVLAGENLNSSITVLNSEFAHNGAGDGYSHGMYAGKIASLTIRDSYFHDTAAGHEIKSRAVINLIENNRILNGGGSASYNVDLPNGGQATVRNNLIHKGPVASNPHIVHFGGEGTPYASSKLVVSGNTVINERGNAQFVLNHSGAPAEVTGNSLFGLDLNDLLRGTGSVSGNVGLASRPAIDTSSVAIGSAAVAAEPAAGPDVLVLQLSQDAYQGNARFTVSVDGRTLGSAQEVTALHRDGQSQAFTFRGDFGAGPHRVGVTFTEDAYGGSSSADRNLYVDGITLNGVALPGASAALWSAGTAEFATAAASGKLTLYVSQDAYQGNAQFTVAVDGAQLGGVQSASAAHARGDTKAVTLEGAFGAGPHTVAVAFLNDAYGGSASTDRNLYVDGVDINGVANPGAAAALLSAGTAQLRVTDAAAGPDVLRVRVAEDAYKGHAQFKVAIDGRTLGSPVLRLPRGRPGPGVPVQRRLRPGPAQGRRHVPERPLRRLGRRGPQPPRPRREPQRPQRLGWLGVALQQRAGRGGIRPERLGARGAPGAGPGGAGVLPRSHVDAFASALP